MSGADKAFAGSIPALYQRYMVPMIFEPYADDLAERVLRLRPRALLEIAAGTGAVTRALAAALGPQTHIVATDLNQPMLDMAASLQAAGGDVHFQQADAQALPFEDARFDVVVCQFGVMFFPDKLQSYREARRVLKPGGHSIFAVWDRLSANDFVSVAQSALTRRFPDDPPLFMDRAPHGYHDRDQIVDAVREAGFTDVSFETVEKTSRASSARDAAMGYCQGTPLRMEIEARTPGELDAVTDMVANALAAQFGEGPIEGRIVAHVVTAQR